MLRLSRSLSILSLLAWSVGPAPAIAGEASPSTQHHTLWSREGQEQYGLSARIGALPAAG